MNEVIIGVGSNINPEENIIKTREELNKISEIIRESKFIYTKPLNFLNQPDYLNGAFLILTNLSISELKEKLLKIEIKLGREKGENKDAPRTIDLDIIVFNKEIVHKDYYNRNFIQKEVKELLPELSDER